MAGCGQTELSAASMIITGRKHDSCYMRPRIHAERRLCALWESTELMAGARQIDRLCMPAPDGYSGLAGE